MNALDLFVKFTCAGPIVALLILCFGDRDRVTNLSLAMVVVAWCTCIAALVWRLPV